MSTAELENAEQVETVDASIAPAAPEAKAPPASEGPYSSADPEYGDADLEEETAAPAEAKQPEPTEEVAAPVAEAKPAEKAEAAESVDEPAAPALDDATLAEAARYGFTKAEAEAFGSSAALQRAMTAMDRRGLASMRGEQAAPKEAPAAPAAPATQAPAAPAPAPATAAGAAAAFEKLKLELDPEKYDPEFIKVVSSINDHYDGVVNKLHESNRALETQLGQVTQRFKQEADQKLEQELDRLFDTATPAPLKEIVGTGSMRSLVATNAPQATARSEIVGQMIALESLDAKAGRQPCSYDQLYQRALRTLHSDKLEAIAREEVRGQVRERRSQAISRPSSRETKALTPERKAANRANEFYKSKGFDVPEMGDADLEDGI